MFDDIKVKISLPDLEDEISRSLTFQTKDTPAQFMEKYEISENGRLIHMKVEYESVPEEERPFYGKPEWEHGVNKFLGCINVKELGWEDTEFHGDLIFYTSHNKEWFEYEARFTEGNFTRVKRIKNKNEF